MTKVEREIYEALAGDDANPVKAQLVATLYAQGHTASHRVYTKIDWQRLDAEIERVLGKRGLKACKRQAIKKT